MLPPIFYFLYKDFELYLEPFKDRRLEEINNNIISEKRKNETFSGLPSKQDVEQLFKDFPTRITDDITDDQIKTLKGLFSHFTDIRWDGFFGDGYI